MVNNLGAESDIWCRYLLGHAADGKSKDLYVKIVGAFNTDIGKKDKKLLNTALQHPGLIGLIDSGCAIIKPRAEIRHRIFTMFSILESNPAYSQQFLPMQHSIFYLAAIFLRIVRASLKTIVGVIMVASLQA